MKNWHLRSGYSSNVSRSLPIGSSRFTGMIRERISSFGAFSEIARFSRFQPSFAILRIPAVRPTVEIVSRSQPNEYPCGSVNTRAA